MDISGQGRRVLEIPDQVEDPFVFFRTGARTRAVMASREGIPHRLAGQWPRVVLKLYKGNGLSSGSKEYQDYHQRYFHQFALLRVNEHVQQSLEAGVYPDVGPYAIVEYIDGRELTEILDEAPLTPQVARQIITDILLEIWIPLWDQGLRFKDCHPGNFIVTPENRVVMIDTEQMRKDLAERLTNPSDWTQREKHERTRLSRLPGLLQRIILATDPSLRKATVLRELKEWLSAAGLPAALSELGRGGDRQQCVDKVDDLLTELERRGYVT